MNLDIQHPNDGTKLNDIAWLISEGYGEKIVIAARYLLRDTGWLKYGGHGYFYMGAGACGSSP